VETTRRAEALPRGRRQRLFVLAVGRRPDRAAGDEIKLPLNIMLLPALAKAQQLQALGVAA